MSHQTEWVSYAKVYPDMQKAVCPEGKWMIKQSGFNDARASYQLPLPDGVDVLTFRREYLPEHLDFNNDEHIRLWAHVTPQDEFFSLPTTDHLKEFIDRLRNGPKNPDKTPEQILLDAGFKPLGYSVENDRVGYDIKIGGKGYISVFLNDREVSSDYSGKNSSYWSNLVNVSLDQTYADGSVHPVYWPEGSDPIRVSIEMLVEVLVEWATNTDLTNAARKKYVRPTNEGA